MEREREVLSLHLSAGCFLSEKVPKEETEEMLLKKTERNRKRRMQAIKRREIHKVGSHRE